MGEDEAMIPLMDVEAGLNGLSGRIFLLRGARDIGLAGQVGFM